MDKSWIFGLIAGITGIISCIYPSILVILINLGRLESINVFSLGWFWGLELVYGGQFSGTTSEIIFNLGFEIEIIYLLLGVVLLIISVITLIISVRYKKDNFSANNLKILFLVFGILFLSLPWLEYGLDILRLGDSLIRAGIDLNEALNTGAKVIPIPNSVIGFLTPGILAFVGRSQVESGIQKI